MQVSIVNTYAWIKATPNSKPINKTKINKGTIWKIAKKSSNNNIVQEKLTITFNNVCPAIKFANSRTPKLIGLKIYDKSSIGTSNNAKPNEVFEGINKDSIWNLCFWIQIMLMPINIEKDSVKVIIRWLVVVKLYGIKPIKL